MGANFTGIWTANLPKSRFPGPPPEAVSVRIEQSGLELQAEMIVTKLDRSQDRVVFKCWINGGRDKVLVNENPVRGGARWEGEELVIEWWVQFATREMHFCDCWSLSSGGRTMTMEHRNDDLAGQSTILERVG
jgi:hypothetical protein